MIGDMQAQLQAGPWLGGARMNISDIALVAYVDRLDRLGFAGLWDGADRIGPWLDAWKHTEAYKLGVAAHVPPGMDEKMRQNGSAKWPDLHRRWEAAV